MGSVENTRGLHPKNFVKNQEKRKPEFKVNFYIYLILNSLKMA